MAKTFIHVKLDEEYKDIYKELCAYLNADMTKRLREHLFNDIKKYHKLLPKQTVEIFSDAINRIP